MCSFFHCLLWLAVVVFASASNLCARYFVNISNPGLCANWVDYDYLLLEGVNQAELDSRAGGDYEITLGGFTDPDCQGAVMRFICARHFLRCSESGDPSLPLAPCRHLCESVRLGPGHVCPLDMVGHLLVSPGEEHGSPCDAYDETECNEMRPILLPPMITDLYPKSAANKYETGGICAGVIDSFFWHPGSGIPLSSAETFASSTLASFPVWLDAMCLSAARHAPDRGVCERYNAACSGFEATVQQLYGGAVSILLSCDDVWPDETPLLGGTRKFALQEQGSVFSSILPLVAIGVRGGAAFSADPGISMAAALPLVSVPATPRSTSALVFVVQPQCPAPLAAVFAEPLPGSVDESWIYIGYQAAGGPAVIVSQEQETQQQRLSMNMQGVVLLAPSGCALPCPFLMFTHAEQVEHARVELGLAVVALFASSSLIFYWVMRSTRESESQSLTAGFGRIWRERSNVISAAAVCIAASALIIAYAAVFLSDPERPLPCRSPIASQPPSPSESVCTVLAWFAALGQMLLAWYYLGMACDFTQAAGLELFPLPKNFVSSSALNIPHGPLFHTAAWVTSIASASVLYSESKLGDGGLTFCFTNIEAGSDPYLVWIVLDGPIIFLAGVALLLTFRVFVSTWLGYSSLKRHLSSSVTPVTSTFESIGGNPITHRISSLMSKHISDIIVLLVWGGEFWFWFGIKFNLDKNNSDVVNSVMDFVLCLLMSYGPSTMEQQLQLSADFCGPHVGSAAAMRKVHKRVENWVVYSAVVVILSKGIILALAYAPWPRQNFLLGRGKKSATIVAEHAESLSNK